MSVSSHKPHGGGIEGRFAGLLEERDLARARAQELAEQNMVLSRRLQEASSQEELALEEVKAALEEVSRTGLPENAEGPHGLQLIANAIAVVDRKAESALRQQIGFDDDEQEAMDAINGALKIISHRWKLKSNQTELASAVHVLQSFVSHHMLVRLRPDKFNNWWQDRPQERTD